jgi:hypothetical protein
MIAFERTSDARLVVHTSVAVGVDERDVELDLGPWPSEAADPAGPLGLASTPVVGLDGPRWAELAAAGVRRAGRDVPCARVGREAERLGLRLLLLVEEGADAVLLEEGTVASLDLVRALGGRPIAALPLERPDDLGGWLAGSSYDVHIPIPALDGTAREELHAMLAPLELEAMHHVVEVDPHPALSEAGVDPAEASLGALAAAAAGVLAGRLAAANRRWRADAGR